MATQQDIEITLHNKKQLKVLVEKMISFKNIKFLFSGGDYIEEICGVNLKAFDFLSNYEKYPDHAMTSIADFDGGYIIGIIVEKKLRGRVISFLKSIKIPERTDDTPTVMEKKSGKKVNLYIESLSEEQTAAVKKSLNDLGILNLEERPFYEQDPVY